MFPWVVARYTLLVLLLLRFKSASSMYLSWTNTADSYSIELIVVRWSMVVSSSHKYSSLIWSQDVFFQSWIIGALSQIVMIVCGPGLRALFSHPITRSPFSLRKWDLFLSLTLLVTCFLSHLKTIRSLLYRTISSSNHSFNSLLYLLCLFTPYYRFNPPFHHELIIILPCPCPLNSLRQYLVAVPFLRH